MRGGEPIRGTVAVVGSEANTTNVGLVAGWRSLGLRAELLRAAEARVELGPDDVAVARLDVVPTLDGVGPGLLELLLLERCGVPVRNSARALLNVHDKLRTAHVLPAAGLPHPAAGAVRAPDDPLPVAPPLVIKPRFGSWGRDVFRCRTEQEARACLRGVADRAWFRRHGALVQELAGEHLSDLRMVVAGGRVVGAIRRAAAPGEWRTNISLGGTLAPVVPDAHAEALAVSAARALGLEIAGVDVLPLAGGAYVVLELNGAVDFDERYSLPGRNVFRDAARGLGLVKSPDVVPVLAEWAT